MTVRGDALSSVAPDIVRWARTEGERFHAFSQSVGVDADTDAVLVYLTSLLREQHLNGAQLRRRLRLLDVSFLLEGRPAPSRDRHLRSYLRGLHAEAALGPVDDRTPLYREDLAAMLDALAADNARQLGEVALLYVANATGVTARALSTLRWRDVRFRRDGVELQFPPVRQGNGPRGPLWLPQSHHPDAVAAVRSLRRTVGPRPGPVFAVIEGHIPTLGVLKPVLDLLPARAGNWSWSTASAEAEHHLAARADTLRLPGVRQLRDAALLTLAYHACLESSEARALQRGHIHRTHQGLLLNIPGRRNVTAIPESGRRYDPCRLWQDWNNHLDRLRLPTTGWAFPSIVNGVVMNTGTRVTEVQLSQIVRTWAGAAHLQGHYSFASLRMGFMRTAARDGVPEYMILNQAGLTVLKSVEMHVRREHLIRHSVVNLLGL